MGDDRIKVIVIDRGSPESGDRNRLYMRYRCPVTGKCVERSTGVPRGAVYPAPVPAARRRDAERVAAKWEKELEDDPAAAGRPQRVTWKQFRERHETEVLASFATKTELEYVATFNRLEAILPILRAGTLADLTEARISRFQRELRTAELAEVTIKKHLTNLRAALNWALKMKMLRHVPAVEMPKRVRGSKMMKGRPITAEEFERMLAKVADVILSRPLRWRATVDLALARAQAGDSDRVPKLRQDLVDVDDRCRRIVASWEHLLRGLFWSGLRLGEALNLKWTDDGLLCVDFAGRRPMFRIRAEGQKSGKDQLLPMAPEFAEFLDATPDADRDGFVFDPIPQRREIERMRPDSVSKIISAIGKAATVKVNETTRGEKTLVKFASAHDLRRAFGDRWSKLVMPAVLQKLMRHESIDTTMKFYVGSEADAMADFVWNARAAAVSGDSSGDTPSESTAETRTTSPRKVAKSRR